MKAIVEDGAGRGRSSFHPATRDWFAQRFEGPSPAQKRAWPHIMAGEPTLIAAPTGSGKTLAAFLCAIDRMVFEVGAEPPSPRRRPKAPQDRASRRGVRILYISPVKALARDVERNLQEPLAGIDLAGDSRARPRTHPRSSQHHCLRQLTARGRTGRRRPQRARG